jgi:hypothetical protein
MIGIAEEVEGDGGHSYDEESARESEGEDPKEAESPDETGESNLENRSTRRANWNDRAVTTEWSWSALPCLGEESDDDTFDNPIASRKRKIGSSYSPTNNQQASKKSKQSTAHESTYSTSFTRAMSDFMRNSWEIASGKASRLMPRLRWWAFFAQRNTSIIMKIGGSREEYDDLSIPVLIGRPGSVFIG